MNSINEKAKNLLKVREPEGTIKLIGSLSEKLFHRGKIMVITRAFIVLSFILYLNPYTSAIPDSLAGFFR